MGLMSRIFNPLRITLSIHCINLILSPLMILIDQDIDTREAQNTTYLPMEVCPMIAPVTVDLTAQIPAVLPKGKAKARPNGGNRE